MADQKFRSFAIFGAMRSGSNLLERYINQFDGLNCHGELFNPAFIGCSGQSEYFGISKKVRDKAPEQLLAAISKADTDNIAGFRIFRGHNQNAIDLFLNDPACAKIILTRDPIDSFVSLKIARKTDQWLIHDETHRKTAQIYFDMQEFSDYREKRESYSKGILARLRETDQPFYSIHYEQLNDSLKINEIAKFIGATTALTTLEQPIKRQNPGALSEKIVNYVDIWEGLDLPEPIETLQILPKFAPEKGTNLSRAYFCSGQNLIFAPIPSAPVGNVRKWLTEIDGTAPENDFGQNAFNDWKSTHGKLIAFSVLRHPLKRAYDVFMRKIFTANTGSFVAIRDKLQTKFGVFLPEKNISFEQSNYDMSAHRAAFKQFLAFIHHNLSQKTDIRTDGRWCAQSALIDGYETEFGHCIAFNESDLAYAAAYLTNRLGATTALSVIEPSKSVWAFDLADIYDSETENLCRIAYSDDYKRFGFENWA